MKYFQEHYILDFECFIQRYLTDEQRLWSFLTSGQSRKPVHAVEHGENTSVIWLGIRQFRKSLDKEYPR